jgi:hypothetical protein
MLSICLLLLATIVPVNLLNNIVKEDYFCTNTLNIVSRQVKGYLVRLLT